MKIELFGLSLELKKNKEKSVLSSDAKVLMSELNQQSLSYISALSDINVKDRITSLCFSDLKSEAASQCLKENGIVAFPSVFESSVIGCQEALSAITEIVRNFNAKELDWMESDNFLIQRGNTKVAGYKNLAEYPKPVIVIRDLVDDGMIDIFNADKLFPDAFQSIKEDLSSKDVRNLLADSENELVPHNFNVYINQGVTCTRGFHVDSYTQQVKGFVYLTDVKFLSQGPYTYVRGSSRQPVLQSFNQAVSTFSSAKTEAPIVSQKRIVPMLCDKGSFIVSDQSGIHRGFPQELGRYRAVAVMNYKQV